MSFVEESGRFMHMTECPFGRRGSRFAIYTLRGEDFARAYACLTTTHATPDTRKQLFNLFPLYEGERVPYALIMKPDELIFRTLYGDVRLCIAEPRLILIHGENGLGFRLASTNERTDHNTRPRGKDGWETNFHLGMALVSHTIVGSLHVDAPWVWDELRTGKTCIDFLPDEQGHMQGSLEEFRHSGYVRESYPEYDTARAAVLADFEKFRDNIPALPGKYDALRERAAWCLWSYLAAPEGLIKREMLFMRQTGPASQWQLTFQSVAFANNSRAAWDQMLAPFDHQSETGQIADFYDEAFSQFCSTRPPIHGWALRLMKKLGYYDQISMEEKQAFYPKLAAWANWFAKYRTDGVDGLPQYEHSNESGMEDGSTFRESQVMVTADLSAYLSLLFEELAEMAKELHLDPGVSEEWMRKSIAIRDRMIEKLWNGERFVAHKLDGTEPKRDYGILGYLPIMLGHRLPDEIYHKLVEGLSRENLILGPYGFDKEQIPARELCDQAQNLVRGFIYHPFNVVLISSLSDCGETELAKKVARRYCDAMLSVDSIASWLNTFSGPQGGEWVSWAAGAYLLIARFTE